MKHKFIYDALRESIGIAGGVEFLYEPLGYRHPNVMRNELNFHNERHKLGLQKFLELLDHLPPEERERLLRLIVNRFGLVALRSPEGAIGGKAQAQCLGLLREVLLQISEPRNTNKTEYMRT